MIFEGNILGHLTVAMSEVVQPRPQGLLGIQNGGSEKNSRSPLTNNIGNFDCFILATGFIIGYSKLPF